MLILLRVHVFELMRLVVDHVVERLIFKQNSVLRRTSHLYDVIGDSSSQIELGMWKRSTASIIVGKIVTSI